MLKKTGGTFAYINIFKRYSEDISSNYEKENIPRNTWICRVGNTLKLCFFKRKFEKILKELLFHYICILLLVIHEGIDKNQR